MSTETAHALTTDSDQVISVLHHPAEASQASKIGVVIIIGGGPQYRVGVSRLFVLLARHLATNGIFCLRFDRRGSGDSTGSYPNFLNLEKDIRCAVDGLIKHSGGSVEKIVLWGECEAATAAALYASSDNRISGLFLVNPWVRTDAGRAKTLLKYYYINRLLTGDFWKKLFSGNFDVFSSFRAFLQNLRQARRPSPSGASNDVSQEHAEAREQTSETFQEPGNLPEIFYDAVEKYNGKVHFLTSGNDMIAQEFLVQVADSKHWKQLIKKRNLQFSRIAEADHSFSSAGARKKMFDLCADVILGESL